MSTLTISRPATPAQMQAEIDRLIAAHAQQYDEIARLRAELAKLAAPSDNWQRSVPTAADVRPDRVAPNRAYHETHEAPDDRERLIEHAAEVMSAVRRDDIDFANDSFRSLPDHLAHAIDTRAEAISAEQYELARAIGDGS